MSSVISYSGVRELLPEGSYVEGEVTHQDDSGDSESEDELKHKELLSAIVSLGRKRRRGGEQRSEAATTVSEYHLSLPAGKGDRVSVGELLRGLGSHHRVGALKKRLADREGRSQPLKPPLPKPQAERVHRAVAYQESSKHVSRWIPIVKKNREAEHLSFPLQEEQPPLPSLTTRVESFKPTTELECEIAAALTSSGEHVESSDQSLTEAERKALLRMSLEEARERRQELQKMRALMSYHEQRCRRAKKIKSKRYHRTQRKKRGPKEDGTAEDSMEKAERLRAKERMTLKHSSANKWARQMLTRGHKDPTTQQALSEHHGIRQQLKQKHLEESESSDSDGGIESMEEEEEEEFPAPPTASRNPWLTDKGGSDRNRLGAVLLLDTEVGQAPTRTHKHSSEYGDQRKPVAGQEDDSDSSEYLPSDFEPDEVNRDGSECEGEVNQGAASKSDTPRPEHEYSTVKAKPKKLRVGGANRQSKELVLKHQGKRKQMDSTVGSSSSPSKAINIDTGAFLLTEGKEEGGRVSLAATSEHLLSVREAFAGDDVVEEFVREKEKEVEKGKPKEVDLTLPGWGVWGGEGVKPPKKKVRVIKLTEPEKQRRDAGLEHVIISEERDKKSAKHQVSTLPWPYTSQKQFEKTHCSPVGRHWNSEATFHQLVKPRVRTVTGAIIEPIRLTEDVQDFMKRTEKKRTRQQGRKKQRIS